MNLSRYTENHTVKFLKYIAGLRKAETSVSQPERQLLVELARGKGCIVEVGVFEGATSEILCREMDPSGQLYLVDPYIPQVRLERLLKISFTRWVATTTLNPWRSRAQFVRYPSTLAAEILPLRGKADLIFIDARHDYESVREDFYCWSPMLAQGAVIAFHDSQQCSARPDLAENDGPVRLMREIGQGTHGAWEIVGRADSVTVVKRSLSS